MNKQNRLIILSTVLVLLLTPVFFAAAGSPQVYISAVSPSKSGYAVDEAVILNGKIKWADLTANKTISIQLWNGTDVLETLESYVIAVLDVNSTVIAEDGSYSGSWTPTSDLTEEVGSTVYYLKVFGTDGLEIDSEAFTVLVATEKKGLSVVWQDQNNDRTAEKNENIVWTIYTSWSFVETTESHSLYVDWGDGVDELIDTISVTAGTSDDTSTESKGFDTEGEHTVTFKLKDTTGSVVTSQTVKINVGSPTSTSDDTSPDTGSGSVISLVTANWQILAIVAAVIVVGVVVLRRKPDDGEKKKGK